MVIISFIFVQGFFTNRFCHMVYLEYRADLVRKTDAAEISADIPTVYL